MAERSDDIDAFDFDFFEEPATEEAAQRREPRRGGPRRPVRPPSGLTPSPAADRPDRVRDRRRAGARAVGAELPGREQAGGVQRLPRRRPHGRERVEPDRSGAEHRLHHARRQAGRHGPEHQGPRPAAAAGGRAGAADRAARAPACRAPPRRRRARPARGGAAPALTGVRGGSDRHACRRRWTGEGSTVPEPAPLAEHMRRLLASDIVWTTSTASRRSGAPAARPCSASQSRTRTSSPTPTSRRRVACARS